MKTGVLAEPVLVGRERELEELQRYLDSALKGKGNTIFISGEAGAGKTRFVNEFLSSAKQKREITSLTGWCLSNVGVPYFPFVEAFNAYFSDLSKKSDSAPHQKAIQLQNKESMGDEESELKSWLMGPRKSGASTKLENLSPQAWKDLTFAAVTNALLAISAKKPTVLFIDDVHWADSASLALLHCISRAIASARVLVLATFRSEDLKLDSEGRPHPLIEALRLMGREDLFKEIRLSGLSQPYVSLLAENMVGGRVQSDLAEKLVSESQGNPLFVVESLRMLSEKGCLVREDNRWRLSIDELSIPSKIKDIILRRVGALRPNQRKILDLASVVGSKFDPELLAAVTGQDNLEILETLNTIAQSSSLVVFEGSFYRFDHAKYREALYEEISPPLRKAYHSRIAEKLETGWKGVEKQPVSDLAYHYAQAGNKEKAVKYALSAGKDALAIFSGAEAIKHFSYVLDATLEANDCANERTEALEGLGDGLYARGNYGETISVFERLNSTANSSLVRLRALRKAMYVSYVRGDYSRSLEIANKAIENPQLDRLENARVRLMKGLVKLSSGNFTEALQLMEGSLKVFEEEYSLPDVADVLAELTNTYRQDGQLENAFAAALRSSALSEYARDLHRQQYAYCQLQVAFAHCGLQKEALEICDETLKIAEKISDYVSRAGVQAWGYFLSGLSLETIAAGKIFSKISLESMRDFGTGAKIRFFLSSLISGSLREFKRDLKTAVNQSLKGTECAEETDSYLIRSHNYGNLTRQYAELGQLEQAEKYYNRMVKLIEETSLAGNVVAHGLYLFSKAVYYSSKKQWKEANQLYEDSLISYKITAGASTFEVGVRRSYAWALLQQGRFADAKVQMEEAKKTLDMLENRLKHTSIQANLMVPINVEVGKDFNARLDIVNAAKNSGTLLKVDGLFPSDFKVTSMQPVFNLQNGSIDLNKSRIKPFQAEAIKFTLKATKTIALTLNPQVVYVDDLGETKTCILNPVNINVLPAQPEFEVVPGRVSTGFADLDRLLLGGIPEDYAVVLSSPSSDERELLIKRFLKTGAEAGETTFYVTVEVGNAKALAEKYPSNFCLLICNPQADRIAQNLPNIFKLRGVENLTEIDIALTKAFRALNSSAVGPKRICIEIVSDVLLQHHAVTTRKWLSALLPDLKSKGFTTLAVVNPQMHSQEEVQAILASFDGEIRVTEKETAKGTEQILKVKKLYNQRYLENELILTKEKIET